MGGGGPSGPQVRLPQLSCLAPAPSPTLQPPSPVMVLLGVPQGERSTHRGAGKTGEASFSSLTGQAHHTTLSSNALRSGSTGSTLQGEATKVRRPAGRREHTPRLGPLRSSRLRQVHQHQGILSRQRGQGGQGDRLHRDGRRGQSHRGGLCRLLCQQGREGQGVQRFPGRGEDSSGFRSTTAASDGPPTLLTPCAPHPHPLSGGVSPAGTHRGAGRTDSASSTRESSSTLAREDSASGGARPPHWARPPHL